MLVTDERFLAGKTHFCNSIQYVQILAKCEYSSYSVYSKRSTRVCVHVWLREKDFDKLFSFFFRSLFLTSTCMSVSFFFYCFVLSFCLSRCAYLSVRLSICLSLFLSVCLSLSLTLFPTASNCFFSFFLSHPLSLFSVGEERR